MKHIYLMLLVAACGRELAAMQAATRTRDEMVAQATMRVQLRHEYDAMRKELAEYNAVGTPSAVQRDAFIKTSTESLGRIKKMERELDTSFRMVFNTQLFKLNSELSAGKPSLETFERLAQSSVISSSRGAQEEGKRSTAAQAEAPHGTAATAQTAGSSAGDTKRQAAITAAGEPAQRESKADAEQAETAAGAGAQTTTTADGNEDEAEGDTPEATPATQSNSIENTIELGALCVTGYAVKGLIRQGGKWVLKGSNPWVAGGLTVIELYRLGKWLCKD